MSPKNISPSSEGKLYAAIDIGSGNLRLRIYRPNGDGLLHNLGNFRIDAHLAEGISPEKPKISRDNLNIAVQTLHAFNDTLSAFNIRPENVCAVMTAAIRAVENTDQGQQDIQTLAEAYGRDRWFIASEEEEARLVALAATMSCPRELRQFDGKTKDMAFAAIGGGSVELGIVAADDSVKNPVALPYGVHPLLEQFGSKHAQSGKIIDKALQKHFANTHCDILAAGGGNWRVVGSTVGDVHLPPTLGKKGFERLKDAARKKESFFRAQGGEIAERAKFVPVSAAALWRIARHFHVKRIVFFEATMADAIAQQLYLLDSGQTTRPAQGLERLYGHSAPEPALPV
ncbi:MAG: hypothetical protein P4M15_14280 [Alphaproteobacteria bacterium]|nr:hypothetical protein [Alphaproteobacteria bacterium]